MKSHPRTLLIGCGYIGLPLALRLQQAGHEITPWVHSQATAESLAPHHFKRIIIGSVGYSPMWNQVDEDFDLVIHCASSSRGGAEAYQEVFLKGGTFMNQHHPEARRLFISSTSVYSQINGEIVTEETPLKPATVNSQILAKAESSTTSTGGLVIRSAGIYGPKRGVLFEKFRKGEAILEGDGLRWLNQIHQHDLIAAIEHLIDYGQPGQIYNATDDTPVTLLDYYKWCSEFLGQPMPPSGSVDPNRKRPITSKRVSNAKLRATGWAPQFPSFREGLTHDHA